MHPLSPDLTSMSDEDLHKKRGELYNRMTFAFQTGNTTMYGQLQLLLGDYDLEIEARNQKMMDKLQSNNKNFGNIINISK